MIIILPILLRLRNRLALTLIHQCDVFIKFNKTDPGEELMDDFVFEVGRDPKFLEGSLIVYHFLFYFLILIPLVIEDLERILISIIIEVYEPIIQEEPMIALLPIGVIYLLTSFYILHSFYDESLPVIGVCPRGLPRSPMIEHVSIGHKAIGLHTLHINPKNSTAHHHPRLRILLEGELTEFGHFFADEVIVRFYVLNLLFYLVKKR